MVVVLIILYWIFVLMNAATMIPCRHIFIEGIDREMKRSGTDSNWFESSVVFK